MSPERARAVARQCVAEGRSVPPEAVRELLAQLLAVRGAARAVLDDLDAEGSVELGDLLAASTVDDLRKALGQ